MLYYAGIGSRSAPEDVIDMMRSIGEQLADKWTLRSGFADGADKAFAYGAETAKGKMENFLPWKGFNGAPHNDDRFIVQRPTPDMEAIAQKYHPAWNACSDAAKLMHTRNVCQVLGHDLQTHSKMVICWTPRGSGSGGTGQAIRIARAYGIPVFDLAIEEQKQQLCAFVAMIEDRATLQVQHPITVVNKHHGHVGEYIGRGSPLGNQYSHMKGTKAKFHVASRELAISYYAQWLEDQVEEGNQPVLNELERLYQLSLQGPLNLQCTCCPLPCHGNTIRDLLIEMHKTR